MSGDERVDAAFEGWLRGAMRGLSPEERAPDALALRILSIPDQPSRPGLFARIRDGQPGALLAAGFAAAVAVLLLSTAFRLQPAGPGAIDSPGTTFDPTIVGPGIVTSTFPSLAIARWALAGAALVFALVQLFGRRPASRMAMILGGLGLLVAYLVSPLLRLDPGLQNGGFDALPLGFGIDAPEGPFDSRDLWYETADPGQPTTIVITLRNAGPLPVRFDGIVGDLGEVFLAAQPWRAVWLGTLGDDGSVAGIERASLFEPTTIEPGNELQVFLVGRAGPCAYGSTFQLGDDSQTGALQISRIVEVAYSVFGLSSSTQLELRMDLAEPLRADCATP